MATFPTTVFGLEILALLSGHSTYLAIYTAPPTKAGGGTEVQREPITLGSATTGGVGRTAERLGVNVLFMSVPVDSDDLLGLAIVDNDTDDVLLVKDDWTPVNTFAAGGNMLIDALTAFTEN